MKDYGHIEKMENCRVQHGEMLRELERLLEKLEAHQEDYEALIEYYYSEQRAQDLRDDEAGLIPSTMKRGVLSEDEIYDLMGEERDAAIHMMEVALRMIKG